MKTRYRKKSDGTFSIADIYQSGEHNLDISKIDNNAIHIVSKLQNYGYETYIVGGAVRDLIQGLTPKDFDIVTAATPRQVHKLFPNNSRVIGKRFKIVHVTINDVIYEVSTFRSLNEDSNGKDNTYGSIEEDAKRRDFSINSLYYNPKDNTLLDFNKAMQDFKKKRISSLIPLSVTFKEDPVRMVRAVKFSVTTGFKLKSDIISKIKKQGQLLQTVSTSRMTEEVNKILASGHCKEIFTALQKYKLLVYMMPCFSVYVMNENMQESLKKLDAEVQKDKAEGKSTVKGLLYLAISGPAITENENAHTPSEIYHDIIRQIKIILSPNTPANTDIEKAAILYMRQHGLKYPKKSPEKKKTANKSNKQKIAKKSGPKVNVNTNSGY